MKKAYPAAVLFWAIWSFLVWVIRPIFLPRAGKWTNDQYWVGEMKCGSVGNDSWGNGYSAYSTPPIWVGAGDFKIYRTKEAAMRDVERKCQ